MNSLGPSPDVRVSCYRAATFRGSTAVRHFVGLHLCTASGTMSGALVRIWGRGLQAVADVVASSRCCDVRLRSMRATSPNDATAAPAAGRSLVAELTEVAAQTLAPLTYRLMTDGSSLRALGLLDFGLWHGDPFAAAFTPCVDATLLAKLTGITVIDDFPARDLAHGGRGGPCEAAGAWLLLADRGILPGRRIRVLVDIDETLRLFLFPPRQDVQLPSQLVCYELGPATSLFSGILQRLTREPRRFDGRDNLAVQGRCLPELMAGWHELRRELAGHWTPNGVDIAPFLQAMSEPPVRGGTHLADVLCTAIHWLSDQITRCVNQHLPRSLPAGQLILAGPLGQHAFLLKQLRTQMPEREIVSIHDQVAATECWRAVAAALLGMLHVDQIPMNSPSLTGADSPRVLGRLTPGSPANWHRVLTDMAETLPEKMPLRSVV